jgi:hypothetical protein
VADGRGGSSGSPTGRRRVFSKYGEGSGLLPLFLCGCYAGRLFVCESLLNFDFELDEKGVAGGSGQEGVSARRATIVGEVELAKDEAALFTYRGMS